MMQALGLDDLCDLELAINRPDHSIPHTMLRTTPFLRLVFIATCFLALTATQSVKAAVLATYELNSATTGKP